MTKAEKYLAEHGINQESVNKFGLKPEDNRLAIPIKDETGAVIYNKYRNLGFDKNTPDSNKFSFDAGSKTTLFNIEALRTDKNYIFLCEGEVDTIRLNQEGLAAVSGTAGAATFKDEWVEHFNNKVVFICYDSDTAGRENAQKVAQKLKSSDIKARIIELPEDCKDLCEFFAKGYTKQDFINLSKNAKEVETGTKSDIDILGFKLDITDPSSITLIKAEVTYKLSSVKDYRADLSVYYADKFCNREILLLTSGKSRATFVKNCQAEEDVKKLILTHVVQLPNVLDEIYRQQLSDSKEAAEELTESDITAAKKLLRSPTLLHDVLTVVKRVGVIGEEENSLAHYLTFTSRLLDDPLSVVVKGESSAGKSYVLMMVMKLMHSSAYVDITDATPQSFYYAPKDYFAHRIIVIFEKRGGERADYSIRSFQSEKKLKIQVPIKDPDTGQFVTKEITVDGPVGFITTTTDAQIHNENETRNLSLYPDESKEQTERIFQVINAHYYGIRNISDEEIRNWQNVQRVLKPYQVVIQFVDELSRVFPKAPIRVRRDYEKFLVLISVITLLHQDQREKQAFKDSEYLIATLADFHIAKVLFEGIFQKTIFELPAKSQLIINAAKEIIDEVFEKVTIREIADHLDWDYDTAKKWFDPALRKGYFTLVDEHKGSKGATYKPTDKEVSDQSILPKTEDLYEIDPSWLGNATTYNPLTGETLKFQEVEITTDVPMEDKHEQYIEAKEDLVEG